LLRLYFMQKKHCIMHFNGSLKNVKKRYWPPWYKSAVDYIQENYHNPLKLDAVAQAAGYNKCHLCLKFKHLTGKTINDYINCVRIEESKKLLKDSWMKIVDIAFAVGFADLSTFNRNFKKIVGITPSEYRKNEHH
jgi:two-component system response regulator YesN